MFALRFQVALRLLRLDFEVFFLGTAMSVRIYVGEITL